MNCKPASYTGVMYACAVLVAGAMGVTPALQCLYCLLYVCQVSNKNKNKLFPQQQVSVNKLENIGAGCRLKFEE